jgi:hypothetical protein
VVFVEGWQIVGPGYSTCMHLAGRSRGGRDRPELSLTGSGSSQEKANPGGQVHLGHKKR